MEEFEFPLPQVINIGVDASAAISFANNTASSGRMKHIDVRCDWMRQLRDRSMTKFVKVPGVSNPADFMTKILTGPEFQRQNSELVSQVHHLGDDDDDKQPEKSRESKGACVGADSQETSNGLVGWMQDSKL